ncbi:hypothetical protein ACFIOY_22170 [Bradyrhizobium sp. TZ2]
MEKIGDLAEVLAKGWFAANTLRLSKPAGSFDSVSSEISSFGSVGFFQM